MNSPVHKRILGLLIALLLCTYSAAAEDDAQEAEGSSNVTVELLKAGDEPRRKLRYQFQEGATEYLSIKMQMTMAMKIGGQGLPGQKMPAIVQVLKVEPKSVESGIMRYAYTLERINIEAGQAANPAMLTAMKQSMDGLLGLSGTARIDDRGFSEAAEMQFPKDASPALIQQLKGISESMSRMSSPLPEEPVGVGAEWKVILPMAMNGVSMKSVNNYSVVGFEGDVVKTNVTTTMQAKDQQVNDPNLPPGATITIDSIVGDGKGTTNFKLNSLCPVSDISVKLKQKATVAMAGQNEQKMDMDIDMVMNVAPASPEEEKEEAAEAAAN